MENILKQLKADIAEVNFNQEKTRIEKNLPTPKYFAHGSHKSPEELRKAISQDSNNKFSKNEIIIPRFPKSTQNELDVLREFGNKHPDVNQFNEKDMEKILGIPERVFTIPTKNDNNGNPILDEHKNPVPQDGSFAYSIKKCSACINFTEDGIPILIGVEKGYKKFEDNDEKGHIYILSGNDSFKAEYDKNEQITEYTTQEDAPVIHHIEVTPENAMKHNVQIVIFKDEECLDNWLDSSRAEGEEFEIIMHSISDNMVSLAKEVEAGRATYINASSRGLNPKIKVLETAEDLSKKENLTDIFISEKIARLKEVMKNKDCKNITNNKASCNYIKPNMSNSDFNSLKYIQDKKQKNT